jgi:hypothetical protein
VSLFHCSCGFAIDDPDELGDHFRQVFTPEDDAGTDGRVHAELADDSAQRAGLPTAAHMCSCGLATDDASEFDDHFLLAFVPPDHAGTDGRRHSVVDPATPDRWHVARGGDE